MRSSWAETLVPNLIETVRTSCADERHRFAPEEDQSLLRDIPAVWMMFRDTIVTFPDVFIIFSTPFDVHFLDRLASLQRVVGEHWTCEEVYLVPTVRGNVETHLYLGNSTFD